MKKYTKAIQYYDAHGNKFNKTSRLEYQYTEPNGLEVYRDGNQTVSLKPTYNETNEVLPPHGFQYEDAPSYYYDNILNINI